MQDEFFAIWRKSDRAFMPMFSGKAGGTHVEPSTTKPPRLFTRHQDAKSALDWWLDGKVTGRYCGFDGECSDLITEKVPSRKAEDFDIVTLRFAVVDHD